MRGWRGRVGQVDRGRRDLVRRAGPSSALRPSAYARPLNAQPAEQVEQPADRLRLEHHRVLARRQLGRLARSRPPSARRARPARARRVAPTRHRGLGRVAAAAARRDADDLHERVGRAARTRAALGRDRHACSCSATVQIAVRLDAVLGGHLERVGERGAARRRVELGGRRVEAVRGRGGSGSGRSRGSVAVAGEPPRRAAAAAPGAAHVARATRRRPRWSPPARRGRRAATAISTVTSSIAVAWVGRERAKRSISERSRVTSASASAPGRAAAARSASSSACHATPTSTSRKRAGAAPCETCIDLARLALAAVEQRDSRHVARRADRVAAAPELAA